MGNPLVSIITPTYNHERYIGQCIESVLQQTYSDWELIIVDDGSTDETPNIIKRYKDSRIKYLRQNNIGIMNLRFTYNRALSLSNGEFIAILEGDDCWPIDKLEKQLPSFDIPKVVLSWGNARIIDENGRTIRYVRNKNFKNTYSILDIEIKELISKFLFSNFLTPTVTVMVRKKSLLNINGFQQPEGVPFVDLPTWLYLVFEGKFAYVNRDCGMWRQHTEQTTRKFDLAMILGHVKTINEFLESLPMDYILQYDLNKLPISTCVSWHKGRIFLKERKWKEAQKEFLTVIFSKYFKEVKDMVLKAFLKSLFHLDQNKIEFIKRYLLI